MVKRRLATKGQLALIRKLEYDKRERPHIVGYDKPTYTYNSKMSTREAGAVIGKLLQKTKRSRCAANEYGLPREIVKDILDVESDRLEVEMLKRKYGTLWTSHYSDKPKSKTILRKKKTIDQ